VGGEELCLLSTVVRGINMRFSLPVSPTDVQPLSVEEPPCPYPPTELISKIPIHTVGLKSSDFFFD